MSALTRMYIYIDVVCTCLSLTLLCGLLSTLIRLDWGYYICYQIQACYFLFVLSAIWSNGNFNQSYVLILKGLYGWPLPGWCCVGLCAGVCGCIRVYTGVYRCVRVYTNVFGCIRMFGLIITHYSLLITHYQGRRQKFFHYQPPFLAITGIGQGGANSFFGGFNGQNERISPARGGGMAPLPMPGGALTHYSLLITHYSLLITHNSLLITHCS